MSPTLSVRAIFPLLAFVGAVATFTTGCTARESPRRRGEDLFLGREPLKGTIRGHQAGLPSEVIRCNNCHGAEARAVTDGASAPPHLDGSWLLSARERRGGPPSTYDAGVFCRLLRTGVDPAHVMVAREMPVYDLDDAACSSLWQYLTGDLGAHGNS